MSDLALTHLLQDCRDCLAEPLEEQRGEDARLMFTAGFVAGAIDEGLAAVRDNRRLKFDERGEDLARLLLRVIEEALRSEDLAELRHVAPIARELLGDKS